jgi:pimeloyl-ACP methyl ester carboxylesterase
LKHPSNLSDNFPQFQVSSHCKSAETKPTVVLVHGAFSDASSWSGVISKLEKDGYPVVAVANPLKSVKGDGDYIRRIVAGLRSATPTAAR